MTVLFAAAIEIVRHIRLLLVTILRAHPAIAMSSRSRKRPAKCRAAEQSGPLVTTEDVTMCHHGIFASMLDRQSVQLALQVVAAAAMRRRRREKKADARRRKQEKFLLKQAKIAAANQIDASFFEAKANPKRFVQRDPSTTTSILFASRPLTGQDKWLGGELCRKNGVIYGVPGSARNIVKISPAADALEDPVVDVIPLPAEGLQSSLTNGRFKWLRGIEAPDGGLYAIPSNGKHVLLIRPNDDGDGVCTSQVATPFTEALNLVDSVRRRGSFRVRWTI